MKSEPITPWIIYAVCVLFTGTAIVATLSYYLITPYSNLAWQQELMGLSDLVSKFLTKDS